MNHFFFLPSNSSNKKYIYLHIIGYIRKRIERVKCLYIAADNDQRHHKGYRTTWISSSRNVISLMANWYFPLLEYQRFCKARWCCHFKLSSKYVLYIPAAADKTQLDYPACRGFGRRIQVWKKKQVSHISLSAKWIGGITQRNLTIPFVLCLLLLLPALHISPADIRKHAEWINVNPHH